MKSNLCIGSEDRLTLSHNVLGLQVSMQYCLTIKHDDMSLFMETICKNCIN